MEAISQQIPEEKIRGLIEDDVDAEVEDDEVMLKDWNPAVIITNSFKYLRYLIN